MFILGNSFYVIEGTAFLYTNPSTTPLWSYSTGKQYISAVSISDDGFYIAGASEDLVSNIYQDANGKLYVFNNLASEKKAPLWNYSILNGFSSLALSGDGSYLIVGGSYDEHRVFLFNTSSRTPEWAYYTGGGVYNVEITPDGKHAAAACGSIDRAYLFNTSESSPISSFITTGLTLRVALSSNGSYMAVSDNAGRLYFYNTSSSSPEWNFTLSEDMSVALSISGNGKYIVSGGDKIYFFKKNSSTPTWTYQTPDYVTSIKISKDGNYIVAGNKYLDNKLYFFNRNSSIPEWIYPARGAISSVAISDNGDYIAALDTQYFVYTFNKNSSKPLWRYRLDGYPTSDYDYSLDISSDGKYIVAGGRKLIYLFDRDILIPSKLIIPGYNLFIVSLMIVLTLFSSIIVIFRKFKKRVKTKFL